MKPKKYISLIFSATVIAVLGVLAVVQYNWQKQIADSEREKMRARVAADTARLAEEFDREIQSAYNSFHIDASSFRSGYFKDFNDRVAYWKATAAYPAIVSEVFFFPHAIDGPASKFDSQRGTFVPAELNRELVDLQHGIAASSGVQPVHSAPLALAVPVYDARSRSDGPTLTKNDIPLPGLLMPPRFGTVVLILDRDMLAEKALPEIADRYLSDSEYRYSVSNKGGGAIIGATDGSDARARLLNISPDRFVVFAGRTRTPAQQNQSPGEFAVDHHVESRTVTRTASASQSGDQKKVQIQVKRAADKIFGTPAESEGPWTLNVQHRDGSVDANVDARLRRSSAIVIGIFALLAVGVLGVFFSAQRARVHAQRQIDFVSSVSHEFRTPLAVIYSAGENLADGVAADTPQIARYGDLIKSEGKKLGAMIEQILEFAGADSGKQKYNFRETNVASVIDDALAECAPLTGSGKFTVERELDESLPPVSADKNALSHAVQNLIANAVKYSNGSKWIRVSAAEEQNRLKITVMDKGIGISRSELRQIFEPFYRSKQVVDAQIHGNGLGLALVKRIVKEHGGKVSAESEIGKGSTFTIEIPLSK